MFVGSALFRQVSCVKLYTYEKSDILNCSHNILDVIIFPL